MISDIRPLLSRLSSSCARQLEGAVGLCVREAHYEVGIGHFLSRLLDDEGNDAACLLDAARVDRAPMRAAIYEELRSCRTGNTARPHFAPPLLELLERAWLEASLNQSQENVRSAAVLLALAEAPHLCLPGFPDNFRQLTSLRPRLAAVLASSVESLPSKSVTKTDASDPGSALARFTVDFTAEARKGKFDPVFGRDKEIRQAIDILSRRRKNNPLFLGEAGVGKTAVVEGLALKIAAGEVPPELCGVRILSLDLGLLSAGAGVRGEFETRLKAVVRETKESPEPVILFIDEAHALIGAGGDAGTGDAANLLKPELARGELRCIAATTFSEFRRHLEKDPAIARRFQTVTIPEPTPAEAAVMLQGLCRRYEEFHGVRIAPEAIDAACELSHRYVPSRQLPDKAIDLLDTAAARVRLENAAHLPDVADGNCHQESVAPEVGPQVLAEVIEEWTGIPTRNLLSDEAATLLSLEESLNGRVIGQSGGIREIATTLRAARMGLTRPEAPRGVFLLAGPSGVGKTETAKAIADLLYGGEASMVVLNMSEYQDAISVTQIKGASAGYVGYGDGGVLTEGVRKRPYAVVVLDEVEKAHKDVLNLFYQVFDQGILRDGEGREVSFRDAVILMTSNLGAETILAMTQDPETPFSYEEYAEAIALELAAHFQPALLSRCKVVPYLPLEKAALCGIAKRKFEAVARSVERHGLTFSVSEAFSESLVDQGGRLQSGARRLDAWIDRELLPEISRLLLCRIVEAVSAERMLAELDEQGNVRVRLDEGESSP